MARVIGPVEQSLIETIKPLRTAQWSADYRWDNLETSLAKLGADYGGIELNPDFQRGHVWRESQQSHFIESCLREVVARSGLMLQFNCATWSMESENFDLPTGLQCLDGLQRYTAIVRFCKGEIPAFGLYAHELDGTQFSIKRKYMTVAIHSFTRRADLLEHYLALNAGGTVHSAEEISRVRVLLEEAKRNAV